MGVLHCLQKSVAPLVLLVADWSQPSSGDAIVLLYLGKRRAFPLLPAPPALALCVCVCTAALLSTDLCSVFLRREAGTCRSLHALGSVVPKHSEGNVPCLRVLCWAPAPVVATALCSFHWSWGKKENQSLQFARWYFEAFRDGGQLGRDK